MYKNGLIGKVRLISKLMTSQPGKQTITIHTLPNISRCKVNQVIKFGLLIEYNMRNIFLKKPSTKCSGETLPRPFLKNQIEHISESIVESFIQFIFIVCQFEGY